AATRSHGHRVVVRSARRQHAGARPSLPRDALDSVGIPADAGGGTAVRSRPRRPPRRTGRHETGRGSAGPGARGLRDGRTRSRGVVRGQLSATSTSTPHTSVSNVTGTPTRAYSPKPIRTP